MIHPFTSFVVQFLRWFVQEFSSFVIISIYSLFSTLPVDRRRPFQGCAISILILSTRISSMPNPLLVINFKMVKDKHNVILILISPKILIPYSWGSSNSRFHLFHLLFFPEFQALIITEIHLNHCKDSPCVFNFSFFSFLLFTGVLHGGSTWRFIKDLIPSQSVHQDSFQRISSILHLVIRSAILSYVSLEVVLCHSW